MNAKDSDVSIPGINRSSRSYWEHEDHYHLTGNEQCRGCGSLVAAKMVLDTVYEAAPSAMVFGRSCGAGRSELQTGGRIGCDGSGMMGIEAAMEARGERGDRPLVILTGEGRALEMGCGDFISSFDRGQELSWIVLDNQAYANSGSAATGFTPLGAATRIYSRATGGKPTMARDMPLMMLFSPARYVATASVAYAKDLITKVREALENPPSYIHIISTCQISWAHSPERGVEIARLGVRAGLTPLWSSKDGVFKRTVSIGSRRRKITDWLKLQGRYRDVSQDDIDALNEHIEWKNRIVDSLEQALS
jgi:pyruvate/2-oxoacid:ferredoxin oxidoreductase beta subunit